MYEEIEVSGKTGSKESKSNGIHTANEKKEVVLRLLRGEPIDEVARELKLLAHILAQWRDDFVEAGTEGLKSRPLSLTEKRLKAAQAKIGKFSMQVDVPSYIAGVKTKFQYRLTVYVPVKPRWKMCVRRVGKSRAFSMGTAAQGQDASFRLA